MFQCQRNYTPSKICAVSSGISLCPLNAVIYFFSLVILPPNRISFIHITLSYMGKQLDFFFFLLLLQYYLWQWSNWTEEHVDPPQQWLYLFLWNSRGRQFNSDTQSGGGRLQWLKSSRLTVKEGNCYWTIVSLFGLMDSDLFSGRLSLKHIIKPASVTFHLNSNATTS